ncbi:MAG: response regulator transcription factor, partial [Blautia sp.]|nr:response regulator transcription factor [Blautia sp.]
MIRVAIVEDEDVWAETLTQYLHRYEKEQDVSFSIKRFRDGYAITDPYPGDLDIILMDIEMGLMNGMEAAQRIREVDEEVTLLFVTNMAQYALEGYKVQAMDYILKPLSYLPFQESMKRALKTAGRRQEGFLLIRGKSSGEKIPLTQIRYIESHGHRLSVHLPDRVVETTVYTMKELEEMLLPKGFARCSSGCLVNLKAVTSFRDKEVVVQGETLPISRTRK